MFCKMKKPKSLVIILTVLLIVMLNGMSPLLQATETELPAAMLFEQELVEGGDLRMTIVDDFNGDGIFDVGAFNDDGTVSVYLDNGDGTFAGEVIYNAEDLPLLLMPSEPEVTTEAASPAVSSLSGSGVTEEWAARYNGPGNSSDFAHAVAVDTSGNVYVTGQSIGTGTSSDYATIKYDTNGNELWAARYNGPGNSSDAATAIAVDTSGSVYVTGYSFGSGPGHDYATIKYDTNGTELWIARYNYRANSGDYVQAIAVDTSGSVYVTGYSYGSGTTGWDYATIKYDTNGNELWVARYNSSGNYPDYAYAIALDSSGNVYVTGQSYGSGGGDYATVKYDTNGNQLWAARYNGLANYPDVAWAMAVDSSGNVYVTGRSWGSGTHYDYATIKYDTNGNELWAARYNGTGNSSDGASAIAVDTSGNVYVTGWSYGSGTGGDYATIKYDTNGNELWAARYNSSVNYLDTAYAIAVDGSDNVYVTGISAGIGTSSDYATIKYDTNGNELWAARYNGPGNYIDGASAIAVDSSGNVYVTGYSYAVGSYRDYATVKYSQVKDPPEAIANLIATVISLNLQQGISNSLDAKLGAALQAIDDINNNNDVAAINTLEAFINAVQAQSGDKIATQDANALIAAAQEIIALLSGE